MTRVIASNVTDTTCSVPVTRGSSGLKKQFFGFMANNNHAVICSALQYINY